MLIQKNPITMIGTIAKCWLFVYRTPFNSVAERLPRPLELVQYGGFAFWNVVVCRVESMRPKISPFPFGVTYWHIAYRLYARFEAIDGKKIEGLYFLRSDCDNALMAAAGNILTDFNFHTATVNFAEVNDSVTVNIFAPGGDAKLLIGKSPQLHLTENSPFDSLDHASQFLKYKPNGISIESPNSVNVVHIDRDEAAWDGRVVQVQLADFAFFKNIMADFEICYEVAPIFYQWNRAVIHKVTQ